ncbi:HNH endonuclease [Clostridium sp. YIM B02505]|uniref:Putative HNH nuclease YajD n=2 Tax=Clostridium yunnanense TaxID=2800325 RepID=A0ABS1EIF1_9CLOT|nr:HNH endonuclease [Clostridium yunnanense]
MDKVKKERYKQYAKDRQDKNEQKFYSSNEWITLAGYVRRKFNGMCVICLLRDDAISYVEAVHHIIEIKDNWELRLSEDNLICLCSSCHSKVHRIYKKSNKDKEKMQEILYRLIEEYEKEYGL